ANPMKHYYVDVRGGMAIVKATSTKSAEQFSYSYFGTLNVMFIRLAAEEETDWYKAMGGVIHETNNVSV
ncbi:hypothetical protein LCGC14_2018040, partial [marine sediment metagenome]